MFQLQNPTPPKLAVLNAFIFSIPFAIVIWWLSGHAWAGILTLVMGFICIYFVVKYFIDVFINKKIKLIFKFIYSTKAGKREEMYYKYILPHKSLDEVEGDVRDWAFAKEKELEILKNNESYRKEFLQNLSHEFKTPLFAIQGYVETLLDGEVSKEITQKFLGNTHNNILRLTHLVNDLDEITKLEIGNLKLNRKNYPILEQIREVFDSLHLKASEKNISCSIKKGSEHAMIVNADREKINRVLTNLVQNAIYYGREGGHVLAGIYRTDDETALIEISDNGQGIDEHSLPRVFERFYRTDAARARNAGGSGLGLSICKHIIEAHGQGIHARSTPGVGTTIGFTLALAR
ncbi:MAG: sensor histidine kinase [Chitinophagaceae bacterium]|nr:sensor histidine kinase [Chitinophagaceae bacterium]MCZ2395247.1 cell wall metabolism sensor histidine kinase WalK [Chitinophagales bacterium]